MMIDLVEKQETLTSVTFERVNLGKVKKSTNEKQLSNIAIIK